MILFHVLKQMPMEQRQFYYKLPTTKAVGFLVRIIMKKYEFYNEMEK